MDCDVCVFVLVVRTLCVLWMSLFFSYFVGKAEGVDASGVADLRVEKIQKGFWDSGFRIQEDPVSGFK